MNLELGKFTEDVLEQTFGWLNDDEIKILTNSSAVVKEDQIKWYKTLSSRTDYLIYAVCVDGNSIGVLGLKHIDLQELQAEYFGYIGNKSYWQQGIGSWMIEETIKVAMEMRLNQIYLNVIIKNYVAINLYFKKGFKITKYIDGNTYRMIRPL